MQTLNFHKCNVSYLKFYKYSKGFLDKLGVDSETHTYLQFMTLKKICTLRALKKVYKFLMNVKFRWYVFNFYGFIVNQLFLR